MPWNAMNKWMFDGQKYSPVPDILLKPKCPVTNYSLLLMFMRHGELTNYLNKYMNNVYMFSIPLEEMLIFIKKCVFEYRLNRSFMYYSKRMMADKLFDILRDKYPTYKNTDLLLLRDMINESPDRVDIYHALGLETPKIKKTKKKKIKKMSYKVYLDKYFNSINA